MKKIIQFWKSLWEKKPCLYCNKPTRQKNWFGEFRHDACWDATWQQRVKDEKQRAKEKEREAEDRRQIELCKRAIREIQDEDKHSLYQGKRKHYGNQN